MWQSNINARIIAHVHVRDGEVQEEGDYILDGVAFPGAEIRLEYLCPCGDDETPMFPIGNVIDRLNIPGIGIVEMTLINAANPTLFIHAEALNLTGNELQNDINNDRTLFEKAERIRAYGAVKMDLASSPEEATKNARIRPSWYFFPALYPIRHPGAKRSNQNRLISMRGYFLWVSFIMQ